MKVYVMLFFTFLLLFGQLVWADEYNNIAISGTVHNPSEKEIRVVLYTYVPGEDNLSSSASLSGTNEFYFVSHIREPLFGRVFYGKESFPLFIEPGYDIHITFDAGNIRESLRFAGVGSKNNSFIAERAFLFETDLSAIKKRVKQSNAQQFLEWAAERRKAQHEMLKSRREALSTSFVSLQEADIDYSWANELFSFYRFWEDNNEGGVSFAGSGLSADFIDQVKLHNYEVILLQSYREFLENYLQLNYSSMKEQLPKENSMYYSNMYKVAKNSLRSLPKYHMQAAYLTKALNYLGVDYVKDEYIEFANECPVQAYKNVLHQMVKAQTVTPKNPEIIFTDKRGRSIPLKELHGNIVLVRFTNNMGDSASQVIRRHDEVLRDKLSAYEKVKFLELPMDYNQEAYNKMIYADASDYLKSIMNRPKPGQEKPKAPPFSYILLNSDGLVVSNSLDDPHNELAMEKIDALLSQEKRNAALELD